jgi:hypothetical protein
MIQIQGIQSGMTMFLLEPDNEVISVHSKYCTQDDVVCSTKNAANCQKLTDTFGGLIIDEDVINEYYNVIPD